jgi:hypothetical protein
MPPWIELGESLEGLRESIDGGFFRDALRYAEQYRLLSDQLAAEVKQFRVVDHERLIRVRRKRSRFG